MITDEMVDYQILWKINKILDIKKNIFYTCSGLVPY